jgi:processive 1,2-diacylglycerol beta-glucosyltransferase
MPTDIVIVYTPVGGGHKAAAMALAEAAKARGLKVLLLDLFDWAPAIVGATYQSAHLGGTTMTPTFYGMSYFAANRRDGALEPLRRGFDHLAFARIVNRVCDADARHVIATHHLPLVVLGRARRTGRLHASLTGVITDYTAHACWAEPGVDAFCVPCPSAARELEAHGVPPVLMTETGIPVRPAFEAMTDVVAPRPGEPLRVLVTSGSFGVGPMQAIVRSFEGIRDVELTVVCGSKRGAEARASRTAALAGVNAKVTGFERDMAARVREAHVVIGKAGGLTVTETMAAGRPMILVGTVPGNELSNERLVVQGGAGYAAAPGDVGSIANAMRAEGLIEAMGKRARGLVQTRSAERVLHVAMAARESTVRGRAA